MQGITAIKLFKTILMMLALGVSLVQAVAIRGNFDTIMMDGNAPAESIQYQNFDNFVDGTAMSDLQMVESRSAAYFLAPEH